MSKLEDLRPGLRLGGVIPGQTVTVLAATPHGADAVELTYKTTEGDLGQRVLDREAESQLAIADAEARVRSGSHNSVGDSLDVRFSDAMSTGGADPSWLVVETAEAIATNRALLESDPYDSAAAIRLGRGLQARGEFDEAWDVFAAVLERDPDHRIARERIAQVERALDAPPVSPRPAATSAGPVDLDATLSVLDGPHRQDALRHIARAIEIVRAEDSQLLAVIAPATRAGRGFAIYAGKHWATAAEPGFLRPYLDQRVIDPRLTDDIRAAGGDFHEPGGGPVAPYSVGLFLPFHAIAAFANRIDEPLIAHVRSCNQHGAGSRTGKHDNRLAQEIIAQASGGR